MSEDTIRERVQRGVEYLSRSYGGMTGLEWLSKVNTRTLQMRDNTSCVIGQVSGNFATSPLIITLGYDYARKWGFYLNVDDIDTGLTYDQLTAEWQRRINELKRERADKLLARANAGLDDSWREDA